jgi:hypothetical protein
LRPTFRDYVPVSSSRVKPFKIIFALKDVTETSVSNTSRHVINQKTEEFSSTAAKAYHVE